MAAALVSHVGAGSSGGGSVTTSSINTTGANFLVAVLNGFSWNINLTISDSKSNTWTPLNHYTSNGGISSGLLYSKNPTVGTGHTFTANVSSGSQYPSILIAAFSGMNTTSPFDVQNGAGSSSNVNSIQPGSITPTETNELIITGLTWEASDTISIDSSFNITDTIAFNSGNNVGGSLAYLIQTSIVAENPTWTLTGSAIDCATPIASFLSTASIGTNTAGFFNFM